MQVIVNFLKAIGTAISTAISFLVSIIQDLVYVAGLVGSTVAKIPSWFSWLPAEVLVIFVALLAVVVIYKIMGRD